MPVLMGMRSRNKQNIITLFLVLLIMASVGCSSGNDSSTDASSVDFTKRLYMISGKTGSLELAAKDNEYIITLYEVPSDVLWITDRPARESGSITTTYFTETVWPAIFERIAPNAVLKFLVENESDGLFLILKEPVYDSQRETLRFTATLIRSTFEDGDPRLEETLEFDDPSIVILNSGDGLNYVAHSEEATVEISGQESTFTIFQEGVSDKVLLASSAPSTFSEVTTTQTLADNWDTMFSAVPPNAFMFGITGNGEMKAYSITLESMEYSPDSMTISYSASTLEKVPIENMTLYSVTLVIDSQEATITIQFDNQILAADGGPCSPWSSDTVTVFLPGQPPGGIPVAPNSKSAPYQLNTGGTGVGIQVNFWYWCQEPDVPVGPASGNKPQNPDNSGSQFKFAADCSFTHQPAVYGKGIETYKIADVTSTMVDGVCVVTIKKNQYTECVTSNCCSPTQGAGECPDITPRQYACPDPPPP